MPLIDVGETAPAFSLKDQSGKTHTLGDYSGRPVVLFFYPKDDTSGCTKEACQFRDALPRFEKVEAVILGVSPQGVASKEKFAAKLGLNFPILADDDAKICEKYGVWQEKSMYGNTYMGVVRTTYLIGPNGEVAHRFDKVKVEGHDEEALSAIKAL